MLLPWVVTVFVRLVKAAPVANLAVPSELNTSPSKLVTSADIEVTVPLRFTTVASRTPRAFEVASLRVVEPATNTSALSAEIDASLAAMVGSAIEIQFDPS